MVTTGFTFRGVHSSEFGIICDPQSRQLIPERRRNLLVVPGRSGSVRQDDGTYEDRTEQFTCYYIPGPGENVSLKAREIAAWLAEDGILSFDNEPEKMYDAFFTGSPTLAKHLKYGEFKLTFTYSPPFAYTAQQSLTQNITSNNDTMQILVDGTAPTPCRIIIRNVGNTTINTLHIDHIMI